MRVRIIVPVCTEKWNLGIEASARRWLGPEMEFEIINLARGPEAIQSEYDEALAAGYVPPLVKEAESKSCHAVIIWCFSDPGLAGAREIADIPVLGLGETSQVFSLALADRIGILTTLDQSVNRIRRKIAARGLLDRISVIRPLNIPVLEYDRVSMVKERVLERGKDMVDKDGIEALILGCGALPDMREILEERLGIPVIDPGAVTLKQTEMVLHLGLRHSKRSFMKPLPVPAH